MPRLPVAPILVLLLVLPFVVGGGHGAPARAAEIETDLDAALARAAERDTRVVVDVWAEWCGPCKTFQADYEKDARIREALAPYEFVSVDAEKEPGSSLVERYPVFSFPTFLLLDADGEELNRTSGYGTPEGFERQVAELVADPMPFAARVERFEADPDAETASALHGMAQSRGDRELAYELAQRAVELGGGIGARTTLLMELDRRWYQGQAELSELVELSRSLVEDPERTTPVLNMAYNVMSNLARRQKDPSLAEPAARAYLAAADTAGIATDPRMAAYLERARAEFVDRDLARVAELIKEGMPEGWISDAGQLNHYAWFCFENRVHLEDGERHARMALELEEADPSALAAVLDTAAEFAFLRGDVDEALRLVRRSAVLDPDEEYYQEQIGRFEGERHRTGGAP